MSQRIRIQNFIRSLATEADFPVIGYDASGMAGIKTTDPDSGESEEVTARPASATCNETQAAYGRDANMGRRVQDRRDQWVFDLHLKFNEEVLLDRFIDELLDDPPILPKDGNLDPAYLRLARHEVAHPPRQQASSGTAATLTFAAMLGRR